MWITCDQVGSHVDHVIRWGHMWITWSGGVTCESHVTGGVTWITWSGGVTCGSHVIRWGTCGSHVIVWGHTSLVPRLHVPPGEKRFWWTKSSFLGSLSKTGNDQWDCKIGNYYVALFPYNSKICSSPFKHPYPFLSGFATGLLLGLLFLSGLAAKMFWSLLGYIVVKRVLAQEIRLGSPDRFSSWEGGVWGRD